MKNFVYRKLITIMRILIIIALLFQQNAAVAEAQDNTLKYDRRLIASAPMSNEREFNFDVLSTAVPSNAILYRFPITKGHISIRGANSAASHEGGAIDLVATDWNVLAVADGEVVDVHYDSNVNCVSYDNYKTWYYRNGHPKAVQRCPFG